MAKLIIDVSEHQGIVDWAAIKPHIDGAIIRCGFGDNETSQDDKYWTRNVAQCEKLGIPYGVYLYSYADNDAHVQSEVAHVLRLIKGHKLSYPVYIDLEEERYGHIAKRAASSFCAAVEKAGYIAGVYTFESFYNQFMRGYDAYTLWLAKYGINDGAVHSKPSIGGVKYDAWQYTSNGRISGYDGRLDVSLFYRDFPAETAKDNGQPETGGTAARVIEIARSQIGIDDGRKYGRWYENNIDRNVNNYDFSAFGVPWCAMFVSWVFDQAHAKCAGLPGAYCPSMLLAARSAGKAVKPRDAKRGDVVYFDWNADDEVDHVGIVESNNADGGYMVTIEGNTDNGEVARKTRYYNCVEAAVRPDYGQSNDGGKPAKKRGIGWRVSCDKSGKVWQPHNNQGKRGAAIRWLAIANVEKYRVFTHANGWLPWVYKCNRHDLENGCAGDGSPILGVQVYDDDAAYSVRVLNGGWYPDMHGLHDTGGTSDNFAGDLVNKIDGFMIKRLA